MPTEYFFVPGRKWKLSYAELCAVLKSAGLKYTDRFSCEIFFIFEVDASADVMLDVFNRLGGFIKFGQMITGDVFDYLENNILPRLIDRQEGVNFAVSAYYEKKSRPDRLKLLGMKIKNWLRDAGVKCRFVFNPKSDETPTVLLEKNDVLQTGFELVLLRRASDTRYGITLALQDFEGFSKRDFGRPNPNEEKGMLPPKLARMMVNYAGVTPGMTVYDPFCGSGTILQEALLMGMKAIGSDIDAQSIVESQDNIKWLAGSFTISSKPKLFQHNTRKPFPSLPHVDVVVTEPYLGPVAKKPLTGVEFEDAVAELRPLYQDFLPNLLKLAEKGVRKRLVLIVPVFKVGSQWKELRFGVSKRFQIAEISGKIRQSDLQWDRPNSIIRRQIKIYEF